MVELRRFVKVEAVAEMFDVKAKTIFKWVKDGKLRSTKFGGCTRFAPEDLEEFIEQGRSDNGSA